jgi:hypothetical protein
MGPGDEIFLRIMLELLVFLLRQKGKLLWLWISWFWLWTRSQF